MHKKNQVRAADPRPARTRAAIMAAVTRLAEGPPAGITVNDILRESCVSRAAFYSQFTDIDDLAVAILRESFREGARTYETELLRAGGFQMALREGIHAIVYHIDRNRNFFRSGLEWRTRSEVPEKVTELLALRLRRIANSAHPSPEAPEITEEISLFLAGGVVALITAWIRDPLHKTVDDMTERIADVLLRSLQGFIDA